MTEVWGKKHFLSLHSVEKPEIYSQLFYRALRKQLTAVEKYALGQIEELNRFWRDSQLAAADAEIEAQKKEFDARKLEEMTEAIGGASATPTEDGSTASETESDDSSDDDDDDGTFFPPQCGKTRNLLSIFFFIFFFRK